MPLAKFMGGTLPVLFLGFLFVSGTFADQNDTHKTVGGIDVYIGVIPAEVIQGRGSAGEKRMHGGVPKRGDRYHLVAALFEQKGGARITDAHVTATVTEPGLAGTKKRLEPMKISDAVTFGNYFVMSERLANRISLEIRVPGKAPVTADFEYAGGGQ